MRRLPPLLSTRLRRAAAVLVAGGLIAAFGLAAALRAPAPPESCVATSSEADGHDMVALDGGTFLFGADGFRPEEAPPRRVHVGPFRIDRHHVTNAQFARFVRETGHVTFAERRDAASGLRNGSLVFSRPKDIRDLQDLNQWWRVDRAADWQHPEGAGSDIARRAHHPVVHVTYDDALAYARWAGRDLPSEAQWEFAARGGLEGALYPWGDAPDSDEAPRANRWRGLFPLENTGSKGFFGTSPVGCFPANGYGLHDMAGNVWHWTRSVWSEDHAAGPGIDASDAAERVIKGGSFLCAPNYCLRYRPAARQPGEAGGSAAHIGFRTVAEGPAR